MATTGGIRTSRPRSRSSQAMSSACTVASGSTVPSTTTTPPTTSLTRRCPSVHVLSGPIAVAGRGARRPAHRRHPRRRPDPAGGLRAVGRPGLGLHRRVRHPERRRVPHRAVPRRLQGDLGLPRRGGDLAARARGLLHRHRAPRADGHRALGGAAGQVERPRAGTDRHRPEPGAAAGAAPAPGLRHPRQPDRRRVQPGRRRGRPHRTAAGERRQPGHQELHQGDQGLLPGLRRRCEPLDG